MFRKLVSNLSFSPSLLNDLVFYSKRLHQEEAIRRTGMVFMTLALVVQSFALISPPQPSLASGLNDIVFGGSTKQDVLDAIDSGDAAGRTDIDDIYRHYNISKAQIQAATPTTIHHSQGVNLFSTGRHRNTVNPAVDKTVTIPVSNGPSSTIYERPLSIWGNKSFDAVTGFNGAGQQFWILLDGCGNIVMESQQNLAPSLDLRKTLESGSYTQTGSNVEYSIQFRNSGEGTAENIEIFDSIPAGMSYVSHSSSLNVRSPSTGSGFVSWNLGDSGQLAPTSVYHWIQVTLRVDSTPVNSSVCNSVEIRSSNHPTVRASDAGTGGCVTIQQTTCPGSGLAIPSGGIERCTVECPDGSTINYTETCQITGCTDQSATNYNPIATINNPSECSYPEACTDPAAQNYVNSTNVTANNSLCVYIVCSDELATNYNQTSNNPGENCVYPEACTDESALNTSDNPKAISNNELCSYETIDGCTDDSAKNFDPTATDDDGSCEYYVYGCTDADATNHNPDADSDDGSCTYRIPVLACQNLQIIKRNDWNDVTLESSFSIDQGITDPKISYYLNDGLLETADLSSSQGKHQIRTTLAEGQNKITAKLTSSSGQVEPNSNCVITENTVKPASTEPVIVKNKVVSNTTKDINNASNTTANGGDELLFKVTLQNIGNAPASDINFQDDIHDLLEYADILDAGGATYTEGSRILDWGKFNLEPRSEVTKTFTARIKNPIPSTPISASDPLSYDMKITNTFGNTVEISLPRTTSKTVEIAATKLPRTGPGTTLTAGLLIFAVAGYMFSRSRLLAKEVDIIRSYEAAGGV